MSAGPSLPEWGDMDDQPSPAETPPVADPRPGDWWVCPGCRSINRAGSDRCYACGVSPFGDRRVAGGGSGRTKVAIAASAVSLALVGALLWSVGLTSPKTAPGSPTPFAATLEPSPTQLVADGPSASPSASPSVSPSGPSIPAIGQPVPIAGVETHTVLRVEAWPGRDPAPAGERYLAVEVRIQANPGKTPRFDQIDYAVANGSGGFRNPLLLGRNPQLGSGSTARGGTVRAWVTFLVPDPGPFTLLYGYPLGFNGEVVRTSIRLDPISKPTPEPTPRPTPRSTPGPARTPGPTTPSSSNWGYPTAIPSTYYSGYGVMSPTQQAIGTVSGAWTQPRVTCDGGSQRRLMSVWVGIEDSTGTDLQQLGTGGQCVPGSKVPRYYAWFEMFPSASVLIAMAVRPGDRFAASVQRHGSDWTLKITNRTTGAKFSTIQTRSTPGTVALWIVEAPSSQATEVGLHVIPLAKYSTVTMTSCLTIVAGVHGNISTTRWAHFRFDMRTTSGIAKAVTGDLRSGGTGFTSVWRHQ